MARWSMVIDIDRCTGCQACVVACQVENNVPPAGADQAAAGRTISWMRLAPFQNGEHGTRPDLRLVPIPCMHCDHPPCVRVCPTGANYKRRDGLVLIHEERCIGCKYCVVACPYQARYFLEEKGIPGKCKLCQPRIDKGVQPACVLACPAGARYFGDLDDPESQVSKLIALKKAKQLRADVGTGPNIYYVR